ncbi:MAG: neutral/alkaline non-lysosomal ceramidase N-terminal domain-containing protein [Leptonema sp. (in: bacteria)]
MKLKKTNLKPCYHLTFLLLWNCTVLSQYEIRIKIEEVQKKQLNKLSFLQVGTSIVDITPPPGFPLAGYSLRAEKSKGFRHKLKSRIVLIRNSHNQSIVFIQADLLSGSKIVRHKVAELISQKYPIDFHSIVFFGTHTHAGPGNYFESNFYNSYASNEPGFDFVYFEFLINQIFLGFEEAWKNQVQAKIAFEKSEIYGFTKNRSLEAYKKNPNISPYITKEKAIQPVVYFIRIDSIENKPIVVISNFSIHPTILPESNSLYHRDVFGYIEKGLEDLVKEKFKIQNFIHFATNYTHGDITANYNDEKEEGDFVIAQEIGFGIAKEMFRLFNSLENSFINDIELKYFAKEIDLFTENKINNIEICNYPIVGLALTTGATTRSTPIIKHLPFFRPGWPRWIFTNGCQGEKRWYLSKLHLITFPKEDFPHILYFQAIQIGSWIYLPFPFEITAESGKLIQNHLQKEFTQNEIIPISCANGYTGYTTTPYEYSKQYYEGGHTLYGKNSTLYLAEIGSILVKNLFKQTNVVAPKEWTFVLRSKTFYPRTTSKLLSRREEYEPPTFIFKKKESYWYFRYWDVPLFAIEFHKPLLAIEKSEFCKTDFKEYLTEESLDLSMHYIKNKIDKTLYEARWYIRNLEIENHKKHCYRFKILSRSTLKEFYSTQFSF